MAHVVPLVFPVKTVSPDSVVLLVNPVAQAGQAFAARLASEVCQVSTAPRAHEVSLVSMAEGFQEPPVLPVQ